MRRIFDFKCPDGHVFEKFVDVEEKKLPCEFCNKVSTRIVSFAGPVLDPISGDFPSATRRWSLNRQQKIKAERKITDSQGLA